MYNIFIIVEYFGFWRIHYVAPEGVIYQGHTHHWEQWYPGGLRVQIVECTELTLGFVPLFNLEPRFFKF